jgi:membrane-bound lytic murein transglycosylase D
MVHAACKTIGGQRAFMKHLICIFIATLSLLQSRAESNQLNQSDTSILPKDTLKDETADAIIQDVIETGKTPAKEKTEYISQLTKYGFKNLFNKFNYSPSLPYSAQVNPHAELYMQGYLQSHSAQLKKMKSWGLPYFNLIDNILSQYGLPRELKYLAVIESNLSTAATSWAGAGGPWQFMPNTARNYGLVVNNRFDERRDYQKSTHAAARYLLNLYKQMHDWLLVIAAYNGGPERVYSAMRKSGSRDFWILQYYLPEESRNHVKKFIATHYIMETKEAGDETANNRNAWLGANPYEKREGITEKEREQSETQTISGKYNAAIIARNLSMETSEFNRYNPGLDNALAMRGQYELVLPSEKMQLFLSIKYQILNECVQSILGDTNVPNNKMKYTPKKIKKKNKYS